MMKFMVEGTGKGAPTSEIMALIPAEIARGQELDAQGLRIGRFVAADLSKVWQVFSAASQDDVQRALESLPLYTSTIYTITPLEEG